MLFNTLDPQILFQEVPDEVSLGFTVLGCPLKCEGCHSQDTWDPSKGTYLCEQSLDDYLNRYDGLITCVVFFGGEWASEVLVQRLEQVTKRGLKTCLYTGMDKVPFRVHQYLTYLKTGRWVPKLGGLDTPSTNQRLLHLSSGNLLNYKFQENLNNVAA